MIGPAAYLKGDDKWMWSINDWQEKNLSARKEKFLSQCHFVYYKSHMDYQHWTSGPTVSSFSIVLQTTCFDINFIRRNIIMNEFGIFIMKTQTFVIDTNSMFRYEKELR
jgi:hypothetical protein